MTIAIMLWIALQLPGAIMVGNYLRRADCSAIRSPHLLLNSVNLRAAYTCEHWKR
jgi:hypothetical protein